MTRKSITRKASDNRYYHPDFHIALNHALDYLMKNMGEASVREYLSRFAGSYYASLKKELVDVGLPATRMQRTMRLQRTIRGPYPLNCISVCSNHPP
jgi:hypothetical protein